MLKKETKPLTNLFLYYNTKKNKIEVQKQANVLNKIIAVYFHKMQTTSGKPINKNVGIYTEGEQFLSLLESIPEIVYTTDIDTCDVLFANNRTKELFDNNIINKKCIEGIFQDNWELLSQTGNLTNIGGWKIDIEKQELSWTKEVFQIHETSTNYQPTIEKSIAFFNGQSKAKIIDALVNAIQHGKPFALDLEIVTAKGNKRYVRVLGTVKNGANKIPQYIIGALLNITDLKEKEAAIQVFKNYKNSLINREKKLIKHNKELQKKNIVKDKFIGNVTTEAKEAFNTIAGFSDILLNNWDKYEKNKIKGFAKAINELSAEAFKLFENLHIWTQIQTGQIAFNPVDINITALINDNVLSSQSLAKKKNISIINKTYKSHFANADEKMMNTILQNLLTNAIKYTNAQGNITITTNIKQYKNKKLIEVQVQDTGVGMSPEKVSSLFQIDMAKSGKGTKNETGTGIGLVLCKEFMTKNRGEIFVASKLGSGTTVTFTIPMSAIQEEKDPEDKIDNPGYRNRLLYNLKNNYNTIPDPLIEKLYDKCKEAQKNFSKKTIKELSYILYSIGKNYYIVQFVEIGKTLKQLAENYNITLIDKHLYHINNIINKV